VAYELQQVTGNIVKFEADFIVNASNTKLILGSGVSMAFKRHCGVKLQKEMDEARKTLTIRQEKIKQGDVVATSSGDAMNFKYALHAAVINYDKGVNQSESKPTLQTIETIFLNTEPYLKWFSEKFGKKSTVVFPYLGCGVGGLDKADVLNLFVNFSHIETPIDAEIKICDYIP